jgi:lipopolysaccharide transport system ATP-binding protein
MGIIGINGAGKSTLLKMLTGTTEPSSGTIAITGQVAALLELGMGFHPEFTGRQNVYMSGQLLGLSAKQIEQLMPQIEAFAGIGEYIDQPVRVYSSGMQVRLAFSVATAVRPDILIVDEALSVGDIEFQHRSFDRIRQFQKQGTTLLIVSHDKQMIMSLCDRAILLHQGTIAMSGEPEAVADYYNAMLSEKAQQAITQKLGPDGKLMIESGTGEVSLLEVKLLDQACQEIELVSIGQAICIQARVQCIAPTVDSLVVGFTIKDRLGQDVYGTNTFHYGKQLKDLVAGQEYEVSFDIAANIGPGTYSISIALHADESHISHNYLWADRVILFNVANLNKPIFVGSSWLSTEVSVRQVQTPSAGATL